MKDMITYEAKPIGISGNAAAPREGNSAKQQIKN